MQENLDILSRTVEQWASQDRPVSQTPIASELEKMLDLSLGEDGCSSAELEKAIHDYVHYSPDVSQAGFNKLLYSGANKPAILGDWITSLCNATMHTYQVGPVATLMELELIDQWNRLVGFKQGDGVMVSGGSQANMIGMMLARHHVCPDIKARGLEGKTLVAYVSDQCHYSQQRSANVLGIGTDNLVSVKTDEQGRIRPDVLAEEIEKSLAKGHTPFYIGLTAGTTVIGAYDPVAACSEIARKHNIWLHIDGAWGAPILFSEKHKHLLADSHLADSFAWDAHKLMNVPITAAVVLVKHAGALRECCAGGGGEYLFHQDHNANYNLGERSIQCGRRADSLKVWLSWKAIGHNGFAKKIDYLQMMKDKCIDMIQQRASFKILAPSAYLNIVFRFEPPSDNPAYSDDESISKLNMEICKTMMREGGPYVDYARYKGKVGVRLILANDQIDSEHIENLLDQCERIGKELSHTL